MKLNNTVLTLALVGVLALAALAGGLLPMGNVVHALPPVFDTTVDPQHGAYRKTRRRASISAPLSSLPTPTRRVTQL